MILSPVELVFVGVSLVLSLGILAVGFFSLRKETEMELGYIVHKMQELDAEYRELGIVIAEYDDSSWTYRLLKARLARIEEWRKKHMGKQIPKDVFSLEDLWEVKCPSK